MKKYLAAVLIVSALLLAPSWSRASAAPVFLSHTVTGSTPGEAKDSINVSIRIKNPGDATLSNLTLSLLPVSTLMKPGTILQVGNLGPHQRSDISFQVEIPRLPDNKEFLPDRLFFAGKFFDTQGQTVEFQVTSYPSKRRGAK